MDDIILGYKNTRFCEEIDCMMSKEFEIRIELPFWTTSKARKKCIFLNQSKYAFKLVKKFRMNEAKDSKIPMSTSCKLGRDEDRQILIRRPIEV